MATKKKTGDDSEKSAKTSAKAAKKPAANKASASSETPTEAQQAPASEAAAASSTAGATAEPAAAITDATTAEAVSTLDNIGLPAARGKAGLLGGPRDRGIKADDKLALPTGKFYTYERVHSLNPKSFYCAMRWDYRALGKSPEEGKRWWANKRILVTNPTNGNRVVVRAVDFGPHENTGLTISLSPGALEALGIDIGDEVEIAFADQKTPMGAVSE